MYLLQNGDIINIDVTVYLNVCFSTLIDIFSWNWSNIFSNLDVFYKLQQYFGWIWIFSTDYSQGIY